jgi:hypothetical protein
MGSLQVPSAGFVHATASSFFLVFFLSHIKNKEIGGALALGGHHSINTYSNQMEVGVWGARPGQTAWGERGPTIFSIKRSVKNKEK